MFQVSCGPLTKNDLVFSYTKNVTHVLGITLNIFAPNPL